MCKLCSPFIILEPKLRIVQTSDQIFPLGIIIKHKHFEFGGGWAGDEQADGISFKNLFNHKILRIIVKNIENIKIIIYIQKENGSVSQSILENIKDQTIKKILYQNDRIYFGYVYNNIRPPRLNFNINVEPKHLN